MARKITTIPATRRLHTGASLSAQTIRKVAGYARVSTDHEDQATSYQAQVDYYTRFISSRADWQMVGIYTDEGISGTSTRRRQGFQTMVEDALAGRIDLIITKSVSRFARNTVDTLTTVRALKDKGVEVYFEKENIWTLDAKGELLITIMSSLAQEESRSISENVTWGHRKRFADGKPIIAYANILGYKRGEGDTMVIDETQAPTVRRIYQLFLDGKSIVEIKHILEAEGHRTSRGSTRWATTTIRSLLRNEKYRGDVLIQKTIVTDFLTKTTKVNEGEVPQYYVTGHHEPIIDPATWDQVQVELATRHGSTRCSKTGLFSSRLKCADCGNWYGRKTWASNTPSKYTVWQCNHKYQGDTVCTTATIRDEQIEAAYLKALGKLAVEFEAPSQMREAIALAFATDELEADIAQIEEQIAELEATFDELIAQNQTAVQDQAVYLKRFEAAEAKYQRACAKKVALETEVANRTSRRGSVQAAYESVLTEPVSRFEPRQWSALIDHAIVSQDRIIFTFKSGHQLAISL
ncbi:recombinase family protein [Corynebacterium striatum]